MGTNTLTQIGTGAPVEATGDLVDQYLTALGVDIVPRNSSGVATSAAGGIGTATYKFAYAYIDNVFIDGTTIGIGTTSPNRALEISSSTAYIRLTDSAIVASGNINSAIEFNGSDARKGIIGYLGSNDDLYIENEDAAGNLILRTVGSDRITIDINGKVLITPGVDSNSAGLAIEGTDGLNNVIDMYTANTAGVRSGIIDIKNGSTTNIKLDGNGDCYLNSGIVGIGSASPTGGTLYVETGSTDAIACLHMYQKDAGEPLLKITATEGGTLSGATVVNIGGNRWIKTDLNGTNMWITATGVEP
jgi:hypothetical protein